MASGIARGRVRRICPIVNNIVIIINTGILVPNMAATLHLVYSVHLLRWTSMLWSIDSCQNEVSANQYVPGEDIVGSSLKVIEVSCFFKLTADQVLVLIGSQVQARLPYSGQQNHA